MRANPSRRRSLYPAPEGPFTTIADGGRARARIVVPAGATALEQFAARELQACLLRIGDATLPIEPEGDQPGEACYTFYTGATRRAAAARVPSGERTLGRDGFVLRSLPGGLIIRGRNDLGTVFGVYELLERAFDVRWFMPGEAGEHVPRRSRVRIGQHRLVFKPAFRVRWVGKGEWSLRQRMNAYVTADGRSVGIPWKWHFHTFRILMPPERYFADHPDYYALVNGKRELTASQTHGNQLCTSHPGVIRELSRNLIAALDAEPETEIVTLSPNDGGGFCECARCHALDEPGRDWFARYSRRLAIFNNEVATRVARKHPNVLIKVGAYAMYARPPADPAWRPAPNLFFQLCHLYFCHNHALAGDGCRAGVTYDSDRARFLPNQTFRELVRQWRKRSPHLFIYEYYAIGGMARAGLPWPLLHTLLADIPWYRDEGVEGFYTQLDDTLWHRLGLNYYLAAKLCWNPDLDPQALLDDTFRKSYGRAAAPMRACILAMERAMEQWNRCVSYGLFGESGEAFGYFLTQVLTPAVLARMERHLARAEHLVAGDAARAARVALTRRMLDETRRNLAARRAAPPPPPPPPEVEHF